MNVIFHTDGLCLTLFNNTEDKEEKIVAAEAEEAPLNKKETNKKTKKQQKQLEEQQQEYDQEEREQEQEGTYCEF